MRDGDDRRGGSLSRYPLEALHEEVAFIAYHFHWDHATIFTLEHRERRRWVEEISKINRKLSEKADR
ncbi:MAG: hypothetical protein DYG89_49075 [Caldilinea sp. CFX5]|nr:hypothetical protein [Caldilinea sp. CFX5]